MTHHCDAEPDPDPEPDLYPDFNPTLTPSLTVSWYNNGFDLHWTLYAGTPDSNRTECQPQP